jgi:hypothetical protein
VPFGLAMTRPFYITTDDLRTAGLPARTGLSHVAVGRTTPGDGYGGVYVWDTVAHTDDNLNYIIPGGTVGGSGPCWVLLPASGGGASSGSLLATTVITSGHDFTTGASTNWIEIEGVGGGGGGGGTISTGINSFAGCGGGSSGGTATRGFAVTPSTTYHYTIGAGGAGGSANVGGDGTDSTFTVGAVTVTAYHGHGGMYMEAMASLMQAAMGGAPAQESANSSTGSGSQAGQPGMGTIPSGAYGFPFGGAGGSSPYGSGGASSNVGSNGLPATGYGAGGAGASQQGTVPKVGGAGSAGCWIVREYS